jgi:long-chain acyl-CoA synthetase
MTVWTQDLISAEEARTLDGLFQARVRRSPGRLAYQAYNRHGEGWWSLTWGEMGARMARWRAALAAEPGLERGDRVAVLLRNCPEWILFEQAALSLGLVVVPLYTDDRADNVAFILDEAGVKVLLVQDLGRWHRLAPVLGTGSTLPRVLVLEARDPVREPAVLVETWLAGADPAAKPWEDPVAGQGEGLEAVGEAGREADPDAIATIVYTSGTTGRPKGVMLSHRNILSDVAAALKLVACYREDLFLSFLPLSHTLERTGGYYLPMMAGAAVAFARSVNQLGEDLQTVRPTVMIAVPRVFERVYGRLLDQLQKRPAPVRWLFRLSLRAGWRLFEYQQGRGSWHPLVWLAPLLRRRVAGPVMARLGGRLRLAVSGGAPLQGEVARLFLSLGLPILQGYGLTETSPVVSVNCLTANDPASVGLVLPGVEVRLGEGNELLVRGPIVMRGYWRQPEATRAILEAEGWLHTGDQARIEGQRITITGRIKDILVLSNGEKVAPAELEQALCLDPLFEQALVAGEGRPALVALLVLSTEHWPPLAQSYALDPEDPASLHDQRLLRDLLQRVRGVMGAFPGHAKIRRLALTLEPWTVENGLLTPTLKVKRAEVLSRLVGVVEQLYATEA